VAANRCCRAILRADLCDRSTGWGTMRPRRKPRCESVRQRFRSRSRAQQANTENVSIRQRRQPGSCRCFPFPTPACAPTAPTRHYAQPSRRFELRAVVTTLIFATRIFVCWPMVGKDHHDQISAVLAPSSPDRAAGIGARGAYLYGGSLHEPEFTLYGRSLDPENLRVHAGLCYSPPAPNRASMVIPPPPGQEQMLTPAARVEHGASSQCCTIRVFFLDEPTSGGSPCARHSDLDQRLRPATLHLTTNYL